MDPSVDEYLILLFRSLHKSVYMMEFVCVRVCVCVCRHCGTKDPLWTCQGAARVIRYTAAVGHPSEIMS